MVWWAAAIGWAQDAAVDPGAAQPPASDEIEQITVWGEAVSRARDAVEQEIVALGYDQVKRKDDRTIFRSETKWKGKVLLTDEGTLLVRRTAPSFKPIDPIAGTKIRPYPLCLVQPTACLAAGSWYVSGRRWGTIEDRVADATASPLSDLSEALADSAVLQTTAELPDRLEAMWVAGTPLVAGPVLATPAERRVALFVYWDTRTENEWGRQVRQVVEDFVLGRVQASDDPYPEQEMMLLQTNRRSYDPFPFPGVAGHPPQADLRDGGSP